MLMNHLHQERGPHVLPPREPGFLSLLSEVEVKIVFRKNGSIVPLKGLGSSLFVNPSCTEQCYLPGT